MATSPPPQEPKPPVEPAKGPQQAHSQPAGLSQETRDLLDFVRTENAANREYFNFLLRIAGSLFGALLALAAGVVVFFGWRTIDDIKKQARAATDAEISKMQEQIHTQLQQRINEEFQTDKMQKLIHDVAVEQTKAGLKNEVSVLRRDLDSVRTDVNHYALPRMLSPKQAADLSAYLSAHQQQRSFVTIRADSHDLEARDYASQIYGAVIAGEWEAKFDTDSPIPKVDFGLMMFVEHPGQRPSKPLTRSIPPQIGCCVRHFSRCA